MVTDKHQLHSNSENCAALYKQQDNAKIKVGSQLRLNSRTSFFSAKFSDLILLDEARFGLFLVGLGNPKSFLNDVFKFEAISQSLLFCSKQGLVSLYNRS